MRLIPSRAAARFLSPCARLSPSMIVVRLACSIGVNRCRVDRCRYCSGRSAQVMSPALRRFTACVDDGMEFADVAVPLVGCKRLQRRGGEPDGAMHFQIPQDGLDEFGDDVGLLPQRGQVNLLGASRNQLAGLQYQFVGGTIVDRITVPAKLLRIPASDRDACADSRWTDSTATTPLSRRSAARRSTTRSRTVRGGVRRGGSAGICSRPPSELRSCVPRRVRRR